MEVPEKIYVTECMLFATNPEITLPKNDKIEYTHTDTFIEKTTEWLCHNYDKYIRIIGSSVYPAYAELCKDFQKAMKGE